MEHRLLKRKKVAINGFLKDAEGEVRPAVLRDVTDEGACLELYGHNFERSARIDFQYVIKGKKTSRVIALRAFVVHVFRSGVGVMFMSKSEAVHACAAKSPARRASPTEVDVLR